MSGGVEARIMGERESARLWCMRHGESTNALAPRGGLLRDAPLTEEGRRQAGVAAVAVREYDPATVYCSDTVRAYDTARILAKDLDVDVVVLKDLTEISVGSADGADRRLVNHEAALALRAWIVDGDLETRVRDGESGQEVQARVTRALRYIADATRAGDPAVVVGHVASLTVGVTALCGRGQQLWGRPLPNAVPFPLTSDGGGWWCRWPT